LLYLCGMKTYLKTPTSDLTVAQIRRVVCETIKWCETNVGTKSYKVGYSVRTRGVKSIPACGVYDYNSRTIMVFRNYSPTVKSVVRAVLHEYTHYLQNLRYYNNVLKKVGYTNHPQEKEARVVETMYSICWNDIKNKI
jgi:predicted secreted protein